ncbi:MAG: hypothetical protein KKA64_02165, partial [Nanoarchaeota archaeon]|nr:hypothetical protein [Nanoarchaeota archaeon]
MKKLFVVIAIGMFLITMFAIAAAEANETNVSETATASEAEATAIEGDITQRVEDVSSPKEISGEVQKYVEEFVEKKGVKAEKINKVSRVNFEDLPKEVNIENVNDANLAIYGVDYNESSNEGEQAKKVFVITYSVDKLRSQGDLIIAQDKREFLNFGSSEKMTAPGFLDTATGVETSLENGYVMMRSGSITGISTGLNVDK